MVNKNSFYHVPVLTSIRVLDPTKKQNTRYLQTFKNTSLLIFMIKQFYEKHRPT